MPNYEARMRTCIQAKIEGCSRRKLCAVEKYPGRKTNTTKKITHDGHSANKLFGLVVKEKITNQTL